VRVISSMRRLLRWRWRRVTGVDMHGVERRFGTGYTVIPWGYGTGLLWNDFEEYDGMIFCSGFPLGLHMRVLTCELLHKSLPKGRRPASLSRYQRYNTNLAVESEFTL
jgi:hypothetical protein